MQNKLKQIADLSLGYTFRGSIKKDSKGSILVVQAKNLTINQDLSDLSGLDVISGESIRAPYFLEYNDILLTSKSSSLSSFRSTVFTSASKSVMVSSSVFVIRIRDVNVLPKYVSLYLNSNDGQKSILAIASGGSYIRNVLAKDLADLEIPIPSIHTQKTIIALQENITKQEKILERTKEIKQNILNSIFSDLTKK